MRNTFFLLIGLQQSFAFDPVFHRSDLLHLELRHREEDELVRRIVHEDDLHISAFDLFVVRRSFRKMPAERS